MGLPPKPGIPGYPNPDVMTVYWFFLYMWHYASLVHAVDISKNKSVSLQNAVTFSGFRKILPVDNPSLVFHAEYPLSMQHDGMMCHIGLSVRAGTCFSTYASLLRHIVHFYSYFTTVYWRIVRRHFICENTFSMTVQRATSKLRSGILLWRIRWQVNVPWCIPITLRNYRLD